MLQHLGRHKLPITIAAGFTIPAGLIFARQLAAARDCVANGGSYDYLHALCFMSVEPQPAADGGGPLVWVTALLGLKLTALVLFAALPARYSPVPRLSALLKRKTVALN